MIGHSKIIYHYVSPMRFPEETQQHESRKTASQRATQRPEDALIYTGGSSNRTPEPNCLTLPCHFGRTLVKDFKISTRVCRKRRLANIYSNSFYESEPTIALGKCCAFVDNLVTQLATPGISRNISCTFRRCHCTTRRASNQEMEATDWSDYGFPTCN